VSSRPGRELRGVLLFRFEPPQNAVYQAFHVALPEAREIQARSEPLGRPGGETDGALIIDARRISTRRSPHRDQAQDYYWSVSLQRGGAGGAGQYGRRVSVARPSAGTRAVPRATGYDTPEVRAARMTAAGESTQRSPPRSRSRRLRGRSTKRRTRAVGQAGRARVLLSLEADLPVSDARTTRPTWCFSSATRATDASLPAAPTRCRSVHAGEGSATGIGTYRVHFEVPPGSYIMPRWCASGRPRGKPDRKLDVPWPVGPRLTVGDVHPGFGHRRPSRSRAQRMRQTA